LCAGTGQIAGNLRQVPDRLAARCVKRTAGIERIGAGTTGTACTATAVAGRYTMDPGNDDLLSLYRTEVLPALQRPLAKNPDSLKFRRLHRFSSPADSIAGNRYCCIN
jgi:hypothetical protein